MRGGDVVRAPIQTTDKAQTMGLFTEITGKNAIILQINLIFCGI